MVISRTLTIFVCVDFHLNRERERVHLHTYFPLSLSSPTFCVFYLFVFILFLSLETEKVIPVVSFFSFPFSLQRDSRDHEDWVVERRRKGVFFVLFFCKDFEVNSVWKRVFCCPRVGLYLFCLMVFPRGFFFFRSWCMGFFFFMGGCFLVQSLSFTVYCCFFCELLKICVSTLPILLGSECSASSQLVLGIVFFIF